MIYFEFLNGERMSLHVGSFIPEGASIICTHVQADGDELQRVEMTTNAKGEGNRVKKFTGWNAVKAAKAFELK